jgi:hypothetical protein
VRRILGNWYAREEGSEREDKPERRTGGSLEDRVGSVQEGPGEGAGPVEEIKERKERPGMADVNASLQEAVALDSAIAAALVDPDRARAERLRR